MSEGSEIFGALEAANKAKPVAGNEDHFEAMNALKGEQAPAAPATEHDTVQDTVHEETEEVTVEEAAEETIDNTDVVIQEDEEDVLIFDEEEAPAGNAESIPLISAEISDKLRELGIEVKSDIELVELVKSLKKKSEDAETAFASEDLKIANDLMKEGGDWQDYLGVTSRDWDAFSDADLVIWKLTEELGSKEDAESAFEEMSEYGKKREAVNIRKEAKAEQAQRKGIIIENTKRMKETYDNNLRQAVTELDQVSKVRLNESDKAKLEKSLLSYDTKLKATEFQKKYFLNEKGEPDFKKMAQSAAKLEMFDKVVEVASSKAKNQGKSEVIGRMANISNPKNNQTIPEGNTRKPLTLHEQDLKDMKEGKAPLF